MARSEDVIYFQLDNRLSVDKLELALDCATGGCRDLRETLENAMKSFMTDTKRLLQM